MKVFVIGGTGAIGRHAVSTLVAGGHDVTALARTEQTAGQLALAGARPLRMSLFDRDALTAAFAGHDAVVNLATAIPSTVKYPFARSWRANARIRTEGSAAVVDAVISAGVARLVQESIVMMYPDGGSEWIDEDLPLELAPIAMSTPVAEGNAHRFTEFGGTGVVLRFGLFYGPGSVQSREMLGFARLRYAVQFGRADGYYSSIHLADAGAAIVAALDAPAGVYNVVDDEPVTKRAYGDAISAAVGRRPLVHGPGRLTLLGGKNLAAVNRSLRVSNRRFREVSGWAPRFPSVREGWAQTAAAIRRTSRAPRLIAGLIALLSLFTGVWALFFPHGFYTSFPGLGRHWVLAEPPYNEHLIRDVGGFYLALGAIACLALVRPTPALLGTLGVAATVEGIPHLTFHLAHAGDLAVVDAIGTATVLGLQVLLGVALVWIALRR